MIDDTILDCTKNNREQSKNRFFCKGPKAIMMFRTASDAMEDTERQADALIKDLGQLWLRIA
jgi:hypothetical protein